MDTNDANKEDVISKIEQLRLDLEKKLVALEESKQKTPSDTEHVKELEPSNIENEDVIQETKKLDEPIILDEEVIVPEIIEEQETVFEISDIIESIPEHSEPIVNIVETPIIEKEEEEVIPPIIVEEEEVISPIIVEEETIEQEKIGKSAIVEPVVADVLIEKQDTLIEDTLIDNTVPVSIENENQDVILEETEQEEPKKRKLNFLIYALALVLLLVTGYFLLDFFKDNQDFEQEKMDRIISTYKNKSYLDSIELADTNNQLLDYQNQLLIDSLANVYEKELEVNNNIPQSNRKSLNKPKPLRKLKNIDDASTDIVNANENVNTDISNSDLVTNTDKTNLPTNTTDIDSENEDNEKLASEEKVATPIANKVKVKNSPIYPGCRKKKSELDKKKCFTSKMYRHIQRKFNSNVAQNSGLKSGIKKIRVHFVIDENGDAVVLKVRAQNKKIEKEAIRVIQSLPKMIPGKVDGKNIQVKYNVPIAFMVEN